MFAPANYYFAIVADLALRFLWTLSLIPASDSSPFRSHLQVYLAPALAALEILRRTMWSCLRLENEHLHNCDRFARLQQEQMHKELSTTGHGHAGDSRQRMEQTLAGVSNDNVLPVDFVPIHFEHKQSFETLLGGTGIGEGADADADADADRNGTNMSKTALGVLLEIVAFATVLLCIALVAFYSKKK
jgi:hypothetical protein